MKRDLKIVLIEPRKEQRQPLTPEELPAGEGDARQHPIPVLNDTDDTNPGMPEGKEYVDADADLTDLDENTADPYAILRDDPFALIQPAAVRRWEYKRLPTHTHTHITCPSNHRATQSCTGPNTSAVVPRISTLITFSHLLRRPRGLGRR